MPGYYKRYFKNTKIWRNKKPPDQRRAFNATTLIWVFILGKLKRNVCRPCHEMRTVKFRGTH